MQSPDHPILPFVQSAGYTRGRPDGPPLWIVIHDMEAGESSARAESTAAYFANPGDGRQVSAHYCVDDNSVVQCVRLADSAWTVGNQPGNHRGINWELSGYARQTRGQWLDPFGLAMFRQMAPIVRADAARFGIPLERRTVTELRAFRPGVTSHNDLGRAFGGTDHTDPGLAFPWDVFLGIMRGEDDDMPTVAEIWSAQIGRGDERANMAHLLFEARNYARAAAAQAGVSAEELDAIAASAEAGARAGVADAVDDIVAQVLDGLGETVSAAEVEAALRRVLGSLDNG